VLRYPNAQASLPQNLPTLPSIQSAVADLRLAVSADSQETESVCFGMVRCQHLGGTVLLPTNSNKNKFTDQM
jgi:hypothetical protein